MKSHISGDIRYMVTRWHSPHFPPGPAHLLGSLQDLPCRANKGAPRRYLWPRNPMKLDFILLQSDLLFYSGTESCTPDRQRRWVIYNQWMMILCG